MRFRKVPVVIEAERVADLLKAAAHDWKSLPKWMELAYDRGDIIFGAEGISIRTWEGQMLGSKGDWIIRGVAGEIYPCKPDIFAATYVAEEGQAANASGRE